MSIREEPNTTNSLLFVGAVVLGIIALALFLYPRLAGNDDGGETRPPPSPIADGWIIYEGAEDAFTVSLPGEPTIEQSAITVLGALLPARLYSIEREASRYNVMVLDFPFEVSGKAEREQASDAVEAVGGRVVAEREARVDGRDGYWTEFVSVDGAGSILVVAIGKQMYSFTYASLGADTPPDATAFFDSIRIHD